jgi:protein tyrosine/serine phosphatase
LRLPKPVLLHCSAGIDRSSPVAAFLSDYGNPP